MIARSVIEPLKCAICGRDRFAHNAITGYCNVFARAEHPPYRLVAHVPANTGKWVLR